MATTYKRTPNKATRTKARETAQRYPTLSSADINTIATQLQTSLNAVGEQLALFNALLMRINHLAPTSVPLTISQIQPIHQNETQSDTLAWLSLSESSFTFWDNKEDAVYDTL